MPFSPSAFAVGQWVTIAQDLSNRNGTFSAGSKFLIVDARDRDGAMCFDLSDRNGNILGEVPERLLEHTTEP